MKNKQVKRMIASVMVEVDYLHPVRWVYGYDIHTSHMGWLEYIEDQDSGSPEPVFYGSPVSLTAEQMEDT